MTSTIRRSIALLLLTALAMTGCDQAGDPPATEILRVKVEPNPVAVGDTATMICVIRDSTDLDPFRFVWFLEGPNKRFYRTDVNRVEWKAKMDPKTYRFKVQVERFEEGRVAESVQEYFDITIIE